MLVKSVPTFSVSNQPCNEMDLNKFQICRTPSKKYVKLQMRFQLQPKLEHVYSKSSVILKCCKEHNLILFNKLQSVQHLSESKRLFLWLNKMLIICKARQSARKEEISKHYFKLKPSTAKFSKLFNNRLPVGLEVYCTKNEPSTSVLFYQVTGIKRGNQMIARSNG